jgi:hypothetical protein
MEIDLYEIFKDKTFKDLEKLLLESETREEKAFYRALLNLKLQIEQEKIIGEILI